VEKYCRMGQATDDRQYGACALQDRYLRVQMHTIKVVKYSLLFRRNNGCTNAPQCYDISILLVLLPFDYAACCLHYKKSWRPTNRHVLV